MPYEWCLPGQMSLKSKSRGPLLMVSDYVSQLNGHLRCTREEREAYIAEKPNSEMARRVRANPGWEAESRLQIEPGAGAGKDK